MKKMHSLLWFSLMALVFGVVSCKKSQLEPELTPEQVAKEDSAFNRSLIDKLGNIFLKEKYEPGAVNITLATFTFGKDSLSYMGNTDNKGKPSLVSGYVYFNSKDNTRYTMSKSDDGKTLLFGSIDANNEVDNFMFSVSAYDDSLVRTIGFTVNTITKTKDILFDIVQSKKNLYSQPSLSIKVLGGNPEVDNNMDSLTIKIKELVVAAVDCLPDWGLNKMLADLQMKYGVNLGGLSDDIKAKLNNSLNAQGEASGFFESISSKLGKLKASAGNMLSGGADKLSNVYSFIQKNIDKYNALLNYTLVKDKGDQQTVFYGDNFADMTIKTISGGKPISLSGYCSISFTQVQTFRIATDKNGIFTLRLFPIDAALESAGPKTMTIVFTLGGDLNKKSLTYTAIINPKPRVKINIDSMTNNQTADVGFQVPKPLRVRVLDSDNRGVPNIKVNWAESTSGVSVSGLGNLQTVTDANGYTTNTWTLNAPLGTVHKATAAIASSSNNSYVVTSGNVSFTATTVKTDSVPIYKAAALGRWTSTSRVNNSAATGGLPIGTIVEISEYELTSDGKAKHIKTTDSRGVVKSTSPTVTDWGISLKAIGNDYYYFMYIISDIFGGRLTNYPKITFTSDPPPSHAYVFTWQKN